jgi:hypothetical protein
VSGRYKPEFCERSDPPYQFNLGLARFFDAEWIGDVKVRGRVLYKEEYLVRSLCRLPLLSCKDDLECVA